MVGRPAAVSFRELVVWQKAHRFVLDVYRFTAGFPKHEQYGLVSQMRRAAVSIPANIAEGFGRHATKEYLRFLFIARGSIAETQSHLLVAAAAGLLSQSDCTALCDLCDSARMTLHGLVRRLRQRLDAGSVAEAATLYADVASPEDLLGVRTDPVSYLED